MDATRQLARAPRGRPLRRSWRSPTCCESSADGTDASTRGPATRPVRWCVLALRGCAAVAHTSWPASARSSKRAQRPPRFRGATQHLLTEMVRLTALWVDQHVAHLLMPKILVPVVSLRCNPCRALSCSRLHGRRAAAARSARRLRWAAQQACAAGLRLRRRARRCRQQRRQPLVPPWAAGAAPPPQPLGGRWRRSWTRSRWQSCGRRFHCLTRTATVREAAQCWPRPVAFVRRACC